MKVHHFYDINTGTLSYVVIDEATKKCAVIDSVMDFRIDSKEIYFDSCQKIIDFIKTENLILDWILETHIHADHLSGAIYLQNKLGGKIALSKNIKEVLQHWKTVFKSLKNVPDECHQFDKLFSDAEIFYVGNLKFEVIETVGHTPACVSYKVEDAVFVGDLILASTTGTARTDFPGGNATSLFRSIQKIFSLPENTKIFICHDYPKEGQDPDFVSTVEYQKNNNILINKNIGVEEFVELRNKRDFNKPAPKLLNQSLQINLGGKKFFYEICRENSFIIDKKFSSAF